MTRHRVIAFPCDECEHLVKGVPPLMHLAGSPRSKIHRGTPEFEAMHETIACPNCGTKALIVKGTDQPPRHGCFWCSSCGEELADGTKKCPQCWQLD